jgi:hypothetical protein
MKRLLLSISIALISVVAPCSPSHAQSCWPYAATSFCYSEFYYPGVYTQDILSACQNQIVALRQANQELTTASKATVTEPKRYDSRIRTLTRNLVAIDRRMANIRRRIRTLEFRRRFSNPTAFLQAYIEEQLRNLEIAQLERAAVAAILSNLRTNRNDFVTLLNAARATSSTQYQIALNNMTQCVNIVVASVMR